MSLLQICLNSDSPPVEKKKFSDPCVCTLCVMCVLVFSAAQPSVTTDEIDRAVHRMIVDAGAYPSPLGYGGFPKSVCTSVNECTCHGIPDSRELQVEALHPMYKLVVPSLKQKCFS